MADIQTREDIVLLVDSFYNKAKGHPLLEDQFENLNWSVHLPIMYNFWSSIVLGDRSYQGNPFDKHVHLPLTSDHFNVWLTLFFQTVDENFSGYGAQEIKTRALSMAGIFRHKMRLSPN